MFNSSSQTLGDQRNVNMVECTGVGGGMSSSRMQEGSCIMFRVLSLLLMFDCSSVARPP